MKRYKLIQSILSIIVVLLSFISKALILPKGISVETAVEMAREFNASQRTASGGGTTPWQTVHFVTKQHVVALIELNKHITHIMYEKEPGRYIAYRTRSSIVLQELLFHELVLYTLTDPIETAMPFTLPNSEEELQDLINTYLYIFTKGNHPRAKKQNYQLKAACTCRGTIATQQDIPFILIPFKHDNNKKEEHMQATGFLINYTDNGAALAVKKKGNFMLLGIGIGPTYIPDPPHYLPPLSQESIKDIIVKGQRQNTDLISRHTSHFVCLSQEVIRTLKEIQLAETKKGSSSMITRPPKILPALPIPHIQKLTLYPDLSRPIPSGAIESLQPPLTYVGTPIPIESLQRTHRSSTSSTNTRNTPTNKRKDRDLPNNGTLTQIKQEAKKQKQNAPHLKLCTQEVYIKDIKKENTDSTQEESKNIPNCQMNEQNLPSFPIQQILALPGPCPYSITSSDESGVDSYSFLPEEIWKEDDTVNDEFF